MSQNANEGDDVIVDIQNENDEIQTLLQAVEQDETNLPQQQIQIEERATQTTTRIKK
jgi:hypothetical protein